MQRLDDTSEQGKKGQVNMCVFVCDETDNE